MCVNMQFNAKGSPMAMTDEELRDRIDRIDDLKKCEIMAINIKTKQGESDLFHHANFRASLLRANEAKRAGRRPDIDYHVIGLKNGDEIYLPDTDVSATIYSHRTLLYKGREVYITPLETELMTHLPRKKVFDRWLVQETGEHLGTMYSKLFPKQSTAED